MKSDRVGKVLHTLSNIASRSVTLSACVSGRMDSVERRRGWSLRAAFAAIGSVALLFASPSEAAENASSLFLGGTKGPLAAATPPSGIFFSNNLYFYSASAGSTLEIPIGGKIVAGVDADLILDMPTVLWVTDGKIFGGRLAVAATIPVGGLDIDASAVLETPGGSIGVGAHDSITTFADPVVTTFLGWNSGNYHWQAGVSTSIPIGDYDAGELANIALHHWAADFFLAATWLDPKIGLDVSGVVGVIVNGKNHATDYRTGEEFHAEFALSQHLSKDFSIGVVGFYYDQLTGDSGEGAVLGDFKGRTVGIGATLGYTFHAGKVPIMTNLRYYHELDVQNRLKGDIAVLSIAIPLWVPGH